jgi:hypothetical protein
MAFAAVQVPALTSRVDFTDDPPGSRVATTCFEVARLVKMLRSVH